MDRHAKFRTVHFLLLQAILILLHHQCLVQSASLSPHQLKEQKRAGKQLFLPVTLWQFPVLLHPNPSFALSHDSSIAPRWHYYSPNAISQIGYRVGGIHQPWEIAGVVPETGASTSVACKTEGEEVGKCMPFSECFPMLEIAYGSENGTEEFVNSPFVEKLFFTTYSSTCSHSHDEIVKRHTSVCCPLKTPFRSPAALGARLDVEVSMPSITQRPPLPKKLIHSRQLNTPFCGQSQAARPYRKTPNNQDSQLKITGGQEASGPLEFPWMVAVFLKTRKIYCGASLITDNFLLSAAHCYSTLSPADVRNLTVHLGDFNIGSRLDGLHEVRKIEKVIINKGFKLENYHNDVALLKLDRPVNFTDRIRPICLPEPTMDSLEKRQLVVTGWGRKYRYGNTVDILRKVQLPIWSLKECGRIYATFAPGRIRDNNICAGDGRRDKDACLGDSGGPAILHDGEKWVQIGITSWGKGCGSFPGVYTRVDKHIMWITKNLNQFT